MSGCGAAMIQLIKENGKQHDSKNAGCIIIGDSRKIRESIRSALKVAQSGNTTVLIEGETGTGKELIARIIHDHSSRAPKSIVCLNCGAFSKDLVESELFGYEKGTFTGGLQEGKRGKFEIANGGTLLLDEVSELVPSAQVKLLRVLEEREFYPLGGTEAKKVDVRIIALTNKSLEKEIIRGTFREDLYYRLNVVRISLPPLRDRREDIIPIACYYMNRFSENFGKSFNNISNDAAVILMNHYWPGNIREVKNVIERIIIMEDDKTIKPSHLSFLECRSQLSSAMPNAESNQAVSFLIKDAFDSSRQKEASGIEIPASGISLDELNKQLILHALHLAGGNRAQAAKLLGISRATANYRIQKYGLENKTA